MTMRNDKIATRSIISKVLIACGILMLVLAIVFLVNRSEDKGVTFSSADQVYPASQETGNIGEKVMGDLKTAKVIVYEYADYGCSHCATWNDRLESIVEESNGAVAVVFRSYNVGFNNGYEAALAATAAQKQGYFEEYKNLLFKNRAEWVHAGDDEATDLFKEYFEKASDGKGDVDQFLADLTSTAVARRVEFENRMGKLVELEATPTFRIDGEKIALSKVIETIEEKLKFGL